MYAADFCHDVLGSVLGHDLIRLLRLFIFTHILEAETHLNRIEEELDSLILLRQLGGRADQTVVHGELAQRVATDTLDLEL